METTGATDMPTGECIDQCEAAAASGGGTLHADQGGGRCAHPTDTRLCVKTVVCGSEWLERNHRTIRLDEDSFLIESGSASTSHAGRSEARPLALHFTPSQVDRALHGAALPVFRDHVRLKAGRIGAHLRTIETALQFGGAAPGWLDEQIVELLQGLVSAEQELDEAAQRINCVKAATRQELMRRLLLATDFIHGHYELPLQLDDIAKAARLSRFHLVRLFRQVLGVTPHAYLLDRRLSVARRLLRTCDSDLNSIAMHSGFGNRWSLFRKLQAQHGTGGRALRDARQQTGRASA